MHVEFLKWSTQKHTKHASVVGWQEDEWQKLDWACVYYQFNQQRTILCILGTLSIKEEKKKHSTRKNSRVLSRKFILLWHGTNRENPEYWECIYHKSVLFTTNNTTFHDIVITWVQKIRNGRKRKKLISPPIQMLKLIGGRKV